MDYEIRDPMEARMPPVFLALAAAAGFFAAARVIASMIDSNVADRAPTGDETGPRATASELARDLGQLEWDAGTGVYRPRPPTGA
jgi:hypothetical protein